MVRPIPPGTHGPPSTGRPGWNTAIVQPGGLPGWFRSTEGRGLRQPAIPIVLPLPLERASGQHRAPGVLTGLVLDVVLSNVARKIALAGSAVPDGPVLLVDDLVDSGWTLTWAGSLLRGAGSGPVHPFALAAAGRGDG